MHGNDCECRETFRTMMLKWLIRLLCRPLIRNGLVRTTRMNTKYGLDQLMMTNMDSPWLAVTPGEWYASDTLTPLSRDLRQMNGIPEVMGAMCDCRTGWDFPQCDSTVVDCNAVELDELTFHRPSFPPEEFPAGGDTCGVVMLDDLIFRRTSFPPDELHTTNCNTVWGFPHMDSAAADCGAVDLIFCHTSFPPNELSAGPDEDYIGLIVWTGPSVRTRPVTGSLLFGHPHGLVYSRLCSTILSIYCLERVDLTQDRHCRTTVVRNTADISCARHTCCIEGCVIRSSIIVILIVILIGLYCFGVFKVRAIVSDGLPDGEQAGPSCAQLGPLPGTFLGPALESLYELAPDIPDVIGLRALWPDAAAVKLMSVRNSRCIRVVTPDDHVTCGYHEILLHDMGEEELLFVSLSELDYLRRIWPRAVFAFMTRYQQDLERKRKECKERFGCTQSGNCTHCGKYIQMDLGKHIAFYHFKLLNFDLRLYPKYKIQEVHHNVKKCVMTSKST